MDDRYSYDHFLIQHGQNPYGGFILYDTHFAPFQNPEEVKDFLKLLKNRYRQELRISANGKTYLIVIYPFIATDCAVNVAQGYCRGSELFDKLNTGDIDKTTTDNFSSRLKQYERLSDIYGKLGMNTFFSPCLDLRNYKGENIDSLNIYAESTSKMLYQKQMIPTLKHFAYSAKVDTHNGSYEDNRNLKTIENNDLKPYQAVERLNIPYMIMPTHFKIMSIDQKEVCTKSNKVKEYISENFPNATTVSDAIDMKGYSKKDALSKRILDNSCDIVVAKTSNLSPNREITEIYQAIDLLKEKNIANNKKSLIKILKLKQTYGLLEVFEARNTLY